MGEGLWVWAHEATRNGRTDPKLARLRRDPFIGSMVAERGRGYRTGLRRDGHTRPSRRWDAGERRGQSRIKYQEMVQELTCSQSGSPKQVLSASIASGLKKTAPSFK